MNHDTRLSSVSFTGTSSTTLLLTYNESNVRSLKGARQKKAEAKKLRLKNVHIHKRPTGLGKPAGFATITVYDAANRV